MPGVLVVADVQNGFVTAHSAPVVLGIAEATRTWQERGGAVVFTRFLNAPGSPYERHMNWTRLSGPPETDLVDGLQSLSAAPGTTILDKPGYTLFTPEGCALVKQHGWADLFICGIATESCVAKTAADAFEAGLTPWVLTDLTASDAGPETHQAGLVVLRRLIGGRRLVTSTALANYSHGE